MMQEKKDKRKEGFWKQKSKIKEKPAPTRDIIAKIKKSIKAYLSWFWNRRWGVFKRSIPPFALLVNIFAEKAGGWEGENSFYFIINYKKMGKIWKKLAVSNWQISNVCYNDITDNLD